MDYVGIVKALRKALADYTANIEGGADTDPTVDKDELIARILEAAAAAEAFLAERGFVLQALVDANGFTKVHLLLTAADAVSASLEERKEYQTFANELHRLLKYANRADIAPAVRKRCNAIIEIDAQLRRKRKHADNVDLMVQINQIISEYDQVEQQEVGLTESRRFDISQIDFDLLRAEFERAKKRNLVLKDLEDLIQERLERMVTANPSRVNYYERYQKIIEDYNSEQDRATIERTFMDLMDLANSMDQEEQRYVREGFESDEELSIYDLLFSENLSKQDIKAIKEVSSSLLKKVKAKIAELDHWTDKQETKATIDTLIRDTLWAELPECYDEISISTYRQKIYEYVYTRYPEVA